MRLPHLKSFDPQPLLFITTCIAARKPLLHSKEAVDLLVKTWSRSADINGWYVGRYVIMPDHVHFFVRVAVEACSLAVWMKSWKSITSRRLSALHDMHPPIWQKDYFDHIVRSAESYGEKWEYVRLNPVRKGLVARPEEWPFQGEIHTLRF